MKSEERHELKTNTLAAFLNDLPANLQKHSSKILTVLALVLLVIAVVRYRSAQRANTRVEVRQALTTAWSALRDLQSTTTQTPEQLQSQITTSVQKVLDDADPDDDRALLANAWLVRGEMFWTLAISSDRPASTQPATTQPAGALSRKEQLESAAAAYQRIVDEYADVVPAVTAARFSLAAIAEDRGEFPAAREQYRQLIESPATGAGDKAMAEFRISLLEDLQRGILLLPPIDQPAGLDDVPPLDTLTGPTLLPTGPTTAPTTSGPTTPGPTTSESATTRPATTRPAGS